VNPGNRLRSAPRFYLETALLFAAGKGLFLIFLYAVVMTFPNAHQGQTPEYIYFHKSAFGNALMSWDGGWYRRIILDGYADDGRAAFFPVFPYLVRALSTITESRWTTGVILNNLLTVGGALFLSGWIAQKNKESKGSLLLARRRARAGALFFVVAPGAVFFTALYTEATFFFVVSGFFFFLARRNYVAAALFGALASATRSTGIFLAPSLFVATAIEAIRYRQFTVETLKKCAVMAAIPLGLLTFMYLLHVQLNDPLAFIKAQAGWGRTSGHMPWETVLKEWQDPSYGDALYRLDALAAVAAVGLAIWSCASGDVLGGIFVALCAIAPLTTGTSMSMSRFLVVVPSLFRAISHFAAGHPRRGNLLFFGMALVAAYFGTTFVLGYWAG
jgi:hypothetical protein